MTVALKRTGKPWYREPWPWFLMAGPAIVIVAAFVTLWLAIRSSDGLVSEDYYKQGLNIAETLARSQRADELAIEAGLRLSENQVRVRLSSRQAEAPAALRLTLSHPTRAGLDQQVRLVRHEEYYTGKLNLPAAGQWLVLVEDDAQTWRVMASVTLPAAGEVVIGTVPNTATALREKG